MTYWFLDIEAPSAAERSAPWEPAVAWAAESSALREPNFKESHSSSGCRGNWNLWAATNMKPRSRRASLGLRHLRAASAATRQSARAHLLSAAPTPWHERPCIPRHVVSQSTGGRTLCSAAPAADELLPECVTEIPRIRSMHMTSASLSLPDALTSRDLRRCAFLRFLRNTFRSSRMSRARLRKLAIWSAS